MGLTPQLLNLFYSGYFTQAMLYQEFKWGSCPHKHVRLLNAQFGSGKPEFSQTQFEHDLGVSIGHRPLPTQAIGYSHPASGR